MCQQQTVVYVRTCDADRTFDADRNQAASLLNKQALFDAHLGRVSGVKVAPFAFGLVCFWII